MPQLERTVPLPRHHLRLLKLPALLLNLLQPPAQNRHLVRLLEAGQEQYLAHQSQASRQHQHHSPSQRLRNGTTDHRSDRTSNQRRKHNQTHRAPPLLALEDIANNSGIEHVRSNSDAREHARRNEQIGGLRSSSDEREDNKKAVADVHDEVPS